MDHIRFYGRRKGRPLSQAMQRRLDEMLPRYALPTGPYSMSSLQELFSKDKSSTPKKLCLEIGFGGGEHLSALAKACPEMSFIGAEPFVNGVASLLRYIEDQELENIRIWPDDVRLILDDLPSGCLSCVYIMFPDPWPKARHAGRRILNAKILDLLAACLEPRGQLRMASDHPVAKSWLLAQAIRHPAFYWTAKSANDWRVRPAIWPHTRYMSKAVREGRTSNWFEFERVLPKI